MQQAKKLCRDIMKAVNQLQDKRDMSINECKLTIAIEDPRSRERREALGIEVSMQNLLSIPRPATRHTTGTFAAQ